MLSRDVIAGYPVLVSVDIFQSVFKLNLNIHQLFYNNKNPYYCWLNDHNLNYSMDNKLILYIEMLMYFVIQMLPVVVDKVGVHNNVKFVVLLDVPVYVEDKVPP